MNIDADRYTEMALRAAKNAETAAKRYNHQVIDNWHLLLALVEQEHGIVWGILEELEITPSAVQLSLQRELEKKPAVQAGGQGQLYADQSFSATVDNAQAVADQLKDEYISTEHLFIGSV